MLRALGAAAQRKYRAQEVVIVRDRTRSDSKQGHSKGRSGVAGTDWAVGEIPTSVVIRIVGAIRNGSLASRRRGTWHKSEVVGYDQNKPQDRVPLVCKNLDC